MGVLREFGLAEKTLALTTDNASSMVSCDKFIVEELENEFRNLDFAHYRCAAHVLNLAVGNGLNLICESVKKVRSLMSYIKTFQPVRDSLKALCEVKGINYLAPELDVATRWNSTFYMLEKWKRMEPALNLLAADDSNVRQRYLNDFDRVKIDDTMVLLSLIERATRLLSASSYPTHGDIRFIFLGIQEHLSRYISDESFSQSTVANAIYQKLSDYWPIMSESSQISSLLDPRVKFSAFNDEIERNNAKNLVLNFTEYSSSSSPLPAETTRRDDIVDTRNFFRIYVITPRH
ncbi:unnamed protein product [Rhizophagus irregularis]|nr:unnamed protein product [Rhizophagus irregularis]